MVLKKETTLYERDEDGKLIPKECKLQVDLEDTMQVEYSEETVYITPLSRGEIRKLFAGKDIDEDRDLDGELIVKHCHNPAFTKDDVSFMKPVLSSIIVNTIFRESGVNLGNRTKKAAIQEAEDDFAKN